VLAKAATFYLYVCCAGLGARPKKLLNVNRLFQENLLERRRDLLTRYIEVLRTAPHDVKRIGLQIHAGVALTEYMH
jgi:hypothetical protein